MPGYIMFKHSSEAALKASTEGRTAKGLILLQPFPPSRDNHFTSAGSIDEGIFRTISKRKLQWFNRELPTDNQKSTHKK